MIEITNFSSVNINSFLSHHHLEPEKVLFLDIETTGLSPSRNRVCLIGCAFLSLEGMWKIRQWFDDTGSSEKELLSSFLNFAQKYDCVIHFNGRAFDLPFLEKRAAADDVALFFRGKKSIDLYRILTSEKSILDLPNYKQQTVEEALGTERTDSTSGRDFVNGYFRFLQTHSEDIMQQILLHNYDDVEGLLHLTPLLTFRSLLDIQLSVTHAKAQTEMAADGTVRDRLYLECCLSDDLPLPIHAHRNGCYMRAEKNQCFFTVPLFTGELKLFFPNYRDYYYLPLEDRAIHRSIGVFADRNHRVPAKAQTCYNRVEGTFLPVFGNSMEDTAHFRENYKDRNEYILFDDNMKCDQKALSRYAEEMFRHML